MGPREPPRLSATTSAAQCSAVPRGQRRNAPDRPGASGAASCERGLRGLPSPDGSHRPGAREFRRGRSVAHPGWLEPGGGDRRYIRWHRGGRPGGAAEGALEPAGELRCDADREAPDLCARPGARAVPTCRRSGPSYATRRGTTTGFHRSSAGSRTAFRFRCGASRRRRGRRWWRLVAHSRSTLAD